MLAFLGKLPHAPLVPGHRRRPAPRRHRRERPCRAPPWPAPWRRLERCSQALTRPANINGTRSPKDNPISDSARITIDPNGCGGRPCIRGLRVRVTDVLSMLTAGARHEQILEAYPDLEAADITAALDVAARQMNHPVLRVA